MTKVKVVANNHLQKKYAYYRTVPVGKHFDSEFKPELTPKQMLALGIFGGSYLYSSQKEFPTDWFTRAKLSKQYNYHLNFFDQDASQPLAVWVEKGWIHPQDPHGWFQWYCRYHMGRRSDDDARQIKRWKAIRRHIAQVQQACAPGDLGCRPKQRQAILHWAYDARKI